MNNKEDLTQKLNTIEENSSTAIEGIAMLAERQTTDHDRVMQRLDKVERDLNQDGRSAVVDLIVDIIVVFIGVVLALVVTGIIYY